MRATETRGCLGNASGKILAMTVALPSKLSRWLSTGAALVLWGALGLVGDWALTSAWRAAQVDEFRRAVDVLASLSALEQFSQPWESDPAWHRLETQLQANLVPLSAEHISSGEPPDADVSWMLSPTGQWRATLTVPLATSIEHVAAIRATRSFDASAPRWLWWSTWALLNLVIGSAQVLTRKSQPAKATFSQSQIQPWLRAARGSEKEPLRRLPQLLKSDSPLAATLDAVASTVNARLEQLERSVDRLQRILQNLNEGVLAVDDQGRVMLMNDALRAHLELGADENVQRPLVEVVRQPRVVELLEYVLNSGQGSEQTLELGNGAFYLRLLAAPLPLDDSRHGVLLTAIDISSTERNELARREFITGASHELKTPLAAIRAYTETLQAIAQDDPQAAQRFLENILSQTDRMDRLVTGMLQLARAEAGNLKLKRERIDAVATIQPCLVAAAAMAQAKAISVEVDMPSSQLLLLADRDAYQTIASNLLSNAVRYTPVGGRIGVRLWSEGDWVVLRVSDTGVGIAEADQQRVFERFYRVQKDRSQDTGGTGLGLAIVKQLTQALDGTVELSSRGGEGTSFEIRLPAVGFTQSSPKIGGRPAQVR